MSQTFDVGHYRLGTADCLFINANATAGTDAARSQVLARLRRRAAAANLHVDLAVLVYNAVGQDRTYGDQPLVDWLQQNPLPPFNKRLTVG